MQYFKSYKEYRRAWDNADKIDPALPLNIDIELSEACNLKCPFCIYSDKNYRKKVNKNPKFIDTNFAVWIIKQAMAIGVPAIKLNWIGEPTLHSQFNSIMKEADGNFHDIIVNTNGNFERNKLDGLRRATKIIISVDSLNAGTYPKIRIGGDINQLLANIYALIKNHPDVWLRRTITKTNLNENFSSDARRLFGRDIKVSEHYVFDRKMKGMPDIDNKYGRCYCGYPSQRLMVDTALDVYPCCLDYRRTMKLGNIEHDSILGLWHSDRLKRIRDALRHNVMPSESCKKCCSYMAYNHPFREVIKK